MSSDLLNIRRATWAPATTFIPPAARLAILALAACSDCFSQGVTLGIASASANPGSTVALNLGLNDPTGDSAASVEWTLQYSAVDFSSATAVVGPAAAAANKSVACNSGAGVLTCVLSGPNATPIANGVVASVSLALSSSPADTLSSLQLTNGDAADAGGSSLPLATTGAAVTIFPLSLNGFTCNSVSIAPPSTATCSVALTSPAPSSGGATIALSAYPIDANVPSSVTIPPGATSATFAVSAGAVTSNTPVTLTASYSGVSETFGMTVDPPAAQATVNSPASSTGNSVTFLGQDTTTLGNWKGVYGQEGNYLGDMTNEAPAHATFSLIGVAQDMVDLWQYTDQRALLKPQYSYSPTERVESLFYAGQSLSFQLNSANNQTHRAVAPWADTNS